jgi:allantoin racemase
MHLLVVNPNTTMSMTEKIGRAARKVAAPGTIITAVSPDMGPASIEGYYDEAFSVPGLLAEIAKGEARGNDAHVLACFDDSGLDAARTLARSPVIGIGEAAFHVASLIAYRFAVITTLSRSIAPIETNLVKYGLDRRCVKIRAAELPVLALEQRRSDARRHISAEVRRAKAEDRAEAIVLGCAGMADLATELSQEHGLPVIDGVAAAVKLAEALVGLGLSTSKVGCYAFALPKTYSGLFAPYAPRS